MMQKIGCRPPYWTTDRNVTACNTKEKLRKFATDIYLEGILGNKEPKYVAKPCVDLQKLLYNFDQNDVTLEKVKSYMPRLEISKNDSIMLIIIDFSDSNFKEIKQVMAFGIENLIGNIGGYIGLFLGLSIVQLPNLFLNVKQWLQPRKQTAIEDHEPNVDLQMKAIFSAIDMVNRKLTALEEKVDRIF